MWLKLYRRSFCATNVSFIWCLVSQRLAACPVRLQVWYLLPDLVKLYSSFQTFRVNKMSINERFGELNLGSFASDWPLDLDVCHKALPAYGQKRGIWNCRPWSYMGCRVVDFFFYVTLFKKIWSIFTFIK